jgi:hypothetical protein
MNQRLVHDCAFALARVLLDMVAHNYREEEHRDIFEAFYTACKAGIEAYSLQDDRMQHRLKPGRN